MLLRAANARMAFPSLQQHLLQPYPVAGIEIRSHLLRMAVPASYRLNYKSQLVTG